MGVIATLQNKHTLKNRFETASAEYLRGDIMPLIIAPDEYRRQKIATLAWDMVRHADPYHPNFESAQARINTHMSQAFASARHYFDGNCPHDFIRKEFRSAIAYMIEDVAGHLAQKPGNWKTSQWRLAQR